MTAESGTKTVYETLCNPPLEQLLGTGWFFQKNQNKNVINNLEVVILAKYNYRMC